MIETCSKDDLIDKYKLVNGTQEQLATIQDRLVSYKTNAFGFNGLIKASDVPKNSPIRFGQPTLDDIMIFYANKEVGQ